MLRVACRRCDRIVEIHKADAVRSYRQHAVPTAEGKPGHLFTTTGATPVSGFSRIKSRLDAAMREIARAEIGGPKLTIPPLVLQDLRRTAS